MATQRRVHLISSDCLAPTDNSLNIELKLLFLIKVFFYLGIILSFFLSFVNIFLHFYLLFVNIISLYDNDSILLKIMAYSFYKFSPKIYPVIERPPKTRFSLKTLISSSECIAPRQYNSGAK